MTDALLFVLVTGVLVLAFGVDVAALVEGREDDEDDKVVTLHA
jgi:hypothetical protein